MENKKVYLAKCNDASSSDVEYVRTNLLRIPGIEIVEYSSGINVSECVSIVLVPDSFIVSDDNEVSINVSSNVSRVISDFINEGNEISSVFAFTCISDSYDNDIEESTPLTSPSLSFTEGINDNSDELTYNNYVEGSLLEIIGDLLNLRDNKSYRKLPRYYKQAPEFSLPPLKDFENRRNSRVKKRPQEIVNCVESSIYSSKPVKTNLENKSVNVKLLARKKRIS